MKKFFLITAVLLLAFFVKAQNYEAIKNTLIIPSPKIFQKAKEDVDKGMTNAKFASKPEAYILKATVYSGLAMDSITKGTPAGDQLLNEAEAAFKKYKEMDPALSFLSDPVYQNAPIHIYSALYSAGYKDYENKKWQEGLEKFKKVVDLSDLLIAQKIITVPVDTNSLILAGIIAENGNQKDEAAKYYSRVADLKPGGQGFESIYRFLVNYYAVKKDMANFEKYKAIGKELYPNNEYFTYDKVDFAVGLEEDLNKRIQALEETIAADPSNYKATLLLGQIIYDTLNSRKEDAVLPANFDELETKMINSFHKAEDLQPSELPFLYIGDHFINKSIRINDERTAHAADMKKRTKPGTASSKEDIAKRDALDEQYATALEAAREPYEKAAEAFAKKPTPLSKQDQQQYKKVAGYLGDIYMGKKNKAKGKPADQAKFAAEEKKWNDMYDTISSMK